MVKESSASNPKQLCLWLLLSLGVFIFGMFGFYGNAQLLCAVAGVVMLLLIFIRRFDVLTQPSVLLFLAFGVMSGITIFWAVSGKFFLREFSKLLIALTVFLLIATVKVFGETAMQRVMTAFAGCAAIFGFLNTEAASTGLTASVINSLGVASDIGLGFEAGTRMTGILGNANTMASILALGIFFSLALISGAKTRGQRAVYSGMLAITAYAFLLAFSMGGIACFAAAILFYLMFAGQQRGAVLVRMLEGAIPSLLFGFASFPFFGREDTLRILPLLFLLCNVALVILLECKLADHIIAFLEGRTKLVLIVLIAVLCLGIAYVAAGMNLTGAYTFGDDALRRSAYPEAGVHTLTTRADGDVTVTITSQDMSQIMMHTDTTIYSGPASEAQFTVPEGSKVCYFSFSGTAGTTLEEALLDGSHGLPLDYKLFPGFVENRIQGLKANQNAIQRTVFFDDGLKLAMQHPLLGCGVGSFESSITSVQDFHYETRYVHNHYIQTAAESGVLGLALFVGGLISLAWVLVRQRKTWMDTPYAWAYPALWAALIMTAAHAAVEVSLSNNIFLLFAYGAFGMIVGGFRIQPTVPADTQESEVKLKGAEKKKAEAMRAAAEKKERTQSYILRGVLCVFPAAFLISLALSFVAKTTVASAASTSVDAFMKQLVTAAAMDPYEHNDYKLSYVMNSVQYATTADSPYRDQADTYAAELLDTPSNSIPAYLVQYYLMTGQYGQSIEAAKMSAFYSASDSQTWNSVISLLSQGFNNEGSPLNGPDGDALAASLKEYRQMLLQRNETSMEAIRLDAPNQDFMDWVGSL